MKMFKKLMAVTLAGVMALAMLTGCGASVNKKEFIAVINDMNSSVNGKVEYTDAGKDQADKVIEVAKKAYDATPADKKADFEPMTALRDEDATREYKSASVNEALGITENTKDHYYFYIAEVQKYDGQFTKEHATTLLAMKIDLAKVELNRNTATHNYGNKGTISMDTVTLGDKEYLVVVMKVIA